MPCFCSSSNVYHAHPHLLDHKHYFESISLTSKQVRDFYLLFCQVNNSNYAAKCEELFGFFDVHHSMFSKRVMMSISTRRIEFFEFVLSVWNYCTADADTLIDLCFRIYLPKTLDYEDNIQGSDMKEMLRDLYGKNYLLEHPKLSSVHKKLVSLNDVPINLEQFKEFCKSHELLVPAFRTQSHLRTIFFGEKFWNQAIKKRKNVEFVFAYKNDFKLEYQELEKYLDLPRQPNPQQPTSSVQNHSRGNATLTAKVQKARRRSFCPDDDEGLSESPRSDHPSLRVRRKSRDEDLGTFDRMTKLDKQKTMGPTEQELSYLQKDVLSVADGKTWRGGNSSEGKAGSRRRGSSSRRRHSFGADSARVAPEGDSGLQAKVKTETELEDSQSRDVPKKKGTRKKNRRLTF